MSVPLHDKTEFTRLYKECEAWLYGYLLSLLRHPDDAEEVLQETMKVCWEKFDQYQPETEFRAWACRIAHYKALQFRQLRNKTPLALSDVLFNSIDEEAIVIADQLDARIDALNKCVQKLPQADRKMLHLRYAPLGTTKSTAEALNYPLLVVYRALARIHNTLYRCISKTLSEENG
ncbi:MAG: sigma-70 family RNA polymerase sigma factor [Pirellulales bacterium]|nr:sigma-70 family RNA polymerase sigma factor [Pirellulales bacterium]